MPNIFIYDEFNPEDNAMLQALYSRSAKSVAEHVDKVRASGSGKFMSTFYVGYGHASIADCGSTTMFIEGISILGDKAIQDWPLYSGQETSTRYIDMGRQPIIDPIGSAASKQILDAWMDFYNDSQEPMREHLMAKYPRQADEDEGVYAKAIKARGFDSLRGFLPAGITTQLSWHSNLRQAWDHLALLRHHPLEEVRQTAESILSGLKEKYPNSFSHQPTQEQEAYREDFTRRFSYFPPVGSSCPKKMETTIKPEELAKYQDLIDRRPAKTGLPIFLGDLGTCTFEFPLDFGSFRDLQRHRSGLCRMPLLTTSLGFNRWYLEQLAESLKAQAEVLIAKQTEMIDALEASPEIKQYYTAIGFDVACRFSFPLPAAAYVIELRSGRTVHPSLRQIAHWMHESLTQALPNLRLYSDLSPDDWDVRRGLADIIKK